MLGWWWGVWGGGLDDCADDGVHHWDGAEAMSGKIMAQGNADACGVWEGKERWARWGCRVCCYLEISCDHLTVTHLKSRRNQILEAAFPVLYLSEAWDKVFTGWILLGFKSATVLIWTVQMRNISGGFETFSSSNSHTAMEKPSLESSSTNPISFCITIRHEPNQTFHFLFLQVWCWLLCAIALHLYIPANSLYLDLLKNCLYSSIYFIIFFYHFTCLIVVDTSRERETGERERENKDINGVSFYSWCYLICNANLLYLSPVKRLFIADSLNTLNPVWICK